jgi:hypothetical protein
MARIQLARKNDATVPEEFQKYIAAAVWIPRAAIKPWERNPRDNLHAVPKVQESIRHFGFVAPICIWTSERRIVAGHTRLAAYDRLLKENPHFVPRGAPVSGVVPVRFHEFRDEKEANAYAIADNKLGEIADWDEPTRKEILQEYRDDRVTVEVMGFDYAEVFPVVTVPEAGGPSSSTHAPSMTVDFATPAQRDAVKAAILAAGKKGEQSGVVLARMLGIRAKRAS